jgi:hypothetical protein
VPRLQIFALQTVLSLIAWSAIARFAAAPRLRALAKADALAWIVAPQMFRHLGASQLVLGLVDLEMPADFAVPTAVGDVATQLLAVAAFVALRRRPSLGVHLAWAVTVFGLGDLLHNVYRGMTTHAAEHMLAAWYVPTFGVPLMLVAHVMALVTLLRKA